MTSETQGRYPYFGVPPPRQPRPAASEPSLTGKRLVLSTPEGFIYDMRASGEIITDGNGRAVIPVLTEPQYFERALLEAGYGASSMARAPRLGRVVRPSTLRR